MSRAAVQDQQMDDLESERDFLLGSIRDLEEEHVAGDVSDDDYTRLLDSYTSRAAEVLRSIEALKTSAGTAGSDADGGGDTSASRPDRDEDKPAGEAEKTQKPLKKKRILLVAGIVSILAGATFAFVISNTSSRLPGNTADGSGPQLPLGQQEQRELDQAAFLEQEGELSQALHLYEEVLSQDPGNPLALSEVGWLEFEAGVVGKSKKSLEQGEANEDSAVVLDPGLASARAYLGTMFLIQGQPANAVIQYRQFLVDGPPTSEITPFLPDMRLAFSRAKEPLPSEIQPAKK